MEHRWGRRFPVDIEVQLVGCPASIGWGRLRNVSLTGGYIETDLALAPLSSVEVILSRTAARKSTRAVVIRLASGGLGVEWLDEMPEIVSVETVVGGASHTAYAQSGS